MKLNHRVIQFGLPAMLLSFSFPVEAQKVPRIGYLAGSDRATESIRSEPFRLALRELGYIEGQNIVIEYRFGGKPGRVAEELRSKRVEKEKRWRTLS